MVCMIRYVGTHVRCAGLIIQLTDGPFAPSQVQESFTDYQGNTFANTFRLIGMCELPEEDSLWLADTNNAGEEFSFFIDAGPAKDDTCYYCYTYVMFPDVAHRIVIPHGECYEAFSE